MDTGYLGWIQTDKNIFDVSTEQALNKFHNTLRNTEILTQTILLCVVKDKTLIEC